MKAKMYKKVITLVVIFACVSMIGAIIVSCNLSVDNSSDSSDDKDTDEDTIYPVERVLTSVDENTITVTWELPLNRFSIDYVLVVLAKDKGNDIIEHVQTVKLERTITEYVFSVLEGDYLISVISVSADGTSKPFDVTSPVNITTGATSALAVNPGYNNYTGVIETFTAGDTALVEIEVIEPVDVGLEVDGVTVATLVSYTLYWKKVASADAPPNTNLYDYDGFSVITQDQVVNGVRLQANFLDSGSKYLFQLVTKNSANILSFSDVFNVFTEEGTDERASSAPTILSIEKIGAQIPSVRLVWEAPKDLGEKLVGTTLEDAEITKYIVYWEEITDEIPVATIQSENQKEVMVVNSDALVTEDFDQANDGLAFGTEYSFIVVAVNDATTTNNDTTGMDKVGIYSVPSGSASVTTIDLSEPPGPVLNATHNTAYDEPTRIKLDWDAVTTLGKMSDGTDAEGVAHRVRYMSSTTANLQEIIDMGQVSDSTTNATLTLAGIIPRTGYRITVETINTSSDITKTSHRSSYSGILDITSGDFAGFTFTVGGANGLTNVIDTFDDMFTVSLSANTVTIATVINIVDATTPPEIKWVSTNTEVVNEFVENSRSPTGDATLVNTTATLKAAGTTVLLVTFDDLRLFEQGFTLIVTE